MQSDHRDAQSAVPDDPERDQIVAQEQVLLEKTLKALAGTTRRLVDSYDQELLSLRDQIAEARPEDLPPLVQQMERLQSIAARRAELPEFRVDARSPYFGHMVLEEKGRRRDVLVGNATHVDTERGIRIVDWRDAPISKLYYRYAEGDEYEEEIAERTLEGVVRVRRSVVISDAVLRRVLTPQGTFARKAQDGEVTWRRLDASSSKLSGGQGIADRPPALEEYSIRQGRLGVRVAGRDDRHLPDIPALIDKRQFDLLSRPSSGLVVIQGGAGSGKTTIGLHRIAYLNFHDSRRFSPDKILVVVFNAALCSYISRVLPGLGVEGVKVCTYGDWAEAQRKKHLPKMNNKIEYTEDTPTSVARLKKHPAMLKLIDERVEKEVAACTQSIEKAVRTSSAGERAVKAWSGLASLPLALRVSAMSQWARGEREVSGAGDGKDLPGDTRAAVQTSLDRIRTRTKDVVWDWAELLTDLRSLTEGMARLAPGEFADWELRAVVQHSSAKVGQWLALHEREENGSNNNEEDAENRAKKSLSGSTIDDEEEVSPTAKTRSGRRNDDDADDHNDDADDNPYRAIDGVDESEPSGFAIDHEDDALLLRLYQRKRGPLRQDLKRALLYEHVFVDEAQDLSPVELSVLIDCVTPAKSVTLAGDTAQRLLMENGFTDWESVLRVLGLRGVSVEPLKIGYRSTAEVLELARAVLGPLADPEPPIATRSGAPVEMHRFPETGAAVAFLGEALRTLFLEEPRASVAVIAKEPDRADVYYEGLLRAEVPRLQRVRSQDFSFKPGVEVTDIRQVKGLEFDYVILVDVTVSQYPITDEARHLLHIGSTRAAHQLWLVAPGEPSRLLPESLRD